MTDWRAVGYGFVVGILASILGLAVPVVGQGVAGLLAGFVAGYLAGGGLGSGAWHGLLAGAIGGLVLAVGIGLLAFVGLSLANPALGFLGGLGVFAVAVAAAMLFAIDSAIAGAVGGIFGPE